MVKISTSNLESISQPCGDICQHIVSIDPRSQIFEITQTYMTIIVANRYCLVRPTNTETWLTSRHFISIPSNISRRALRRALDLHLRLKLCLHRVEQIIQVVLLLLYSVR